MEDLYKKIEALRDMVKGILSKPNSNSLVPALKLPTPKPLSMPSMSSTAAPTKIPGVAPPSGKDPKKVAEQLKNPRPKKVKVEILKFEKNGQWSLEKGSMGRLAPISHKDAISYQLDKPEVEDWTTGGAAGEPNREARERMPRLEGPARQRGLHKLSSLTQSRINPQTKEREFLLHRGTSNDEIKAHGSGELDMKTSWTPHLHMANEFAENNLGDVLSAWVPEKHIHHMPWAIGATPGDFKDEREVIVNPHKLNVPEKQKE